MNKWVKCLISLLMCLLLIGNVTAVGVFAEDSPSLSLDTPAVEETGTLENEADNTDIAEQDTEITTGVEDTFDSASITSAAANSYNRDEAIKYAKVHWNDGKGICAEFASDCIKAGGCGVWDTYCPNLWNKLIKSGMGIGYSVPTTTITVGTAGVAFTGKVQLDVRRCTQGLEKGDLIFWGDKNDANRKCHVVVYSGENNGNYPKFYAHNGNRYNEAAGYNYYGKAKYHVKDCFIYHFNGSSDPRTNARDDGSGFYAYIINRVPWKHIENRNNNVQIAANGNDGYDPRQIWHFQKTPGNYNNCYTITNEYDGNCIDLANQGTADGTQIWMVNPNNSSAQKWYIVYDGSVNKTYLYSDVCSKVMDMSGNNSAAGTNIALWTANGTEAQNWSVYKLTADGWNYKKPSRPAKPNITSVTGKAAGEPTTINWSACALQDTKLDARVYDVRIWSGTSASGTTYNAKFGLTGTSYTVTLPKGTYTVQIAAVNSKYYEWFTMGNTFTFTVGCDHNWADSSVTKNATCTENGIKVQKCSACGQTRNVEIQATGHAWNEGIVTMDPTVSSVGVRTYTCRNCSGTKTEQIAATGNNPVGELETVHACEDSVTVSGWAYDTDDLSGALTVEIYINGKKCDEAAADQERTDIHNKYGCGENHGFKKTVPTTATGNITVEARAVNIGGFSGFSNSSTTLSRSLVVTLPGMHEVLLEDGLEATCTEAGMTESIYCTVCGETITEAEEIPALGHDWDGGTTLQEATCTAYGSIRYTCTRCGEVMTDIIPALGHVLERVEAVEATAEMDGNIEYYQCTQCGLLFKDELGSDEITTEDTVVPWGWDNGIVTKEATCTEEGTILYTSKEDPSVTMEVSVPPLGHCAYKVNAVDATCLAEGQIEYFVCSRCGNLYREATCINELRPEETIVAPLGHSYDTGTVTKQPGCTSTGIRTYTCERDPSHKTIEILPALGHSLEKVEAVAPTQDHPGNIEHYRCIREGCGRLFADGEGLRGLNEQEILLPAGIGGILNDNCSWFLTNDGTLTISGSGSMESQEWPDWVNYPERIVSLIVEEGITDIPDFVFEGEENLTEVSLPGSVKKIGWQSFYGCSALKEIVLPDGLEEIGSSAFDKCGLTAVHLPNSVGLVNSNAFSDCTELQYFSIGKGTETIAADFVDGCSALLEFEVSEDNSKYKAADGVLYSKDGSVLVRYPAGSPAESFDVPEGVTTIAEYSFKGCRNLTAIHFPESLKKIQAYYEFGGAFTGCEGLTALDLPVGLEYMNWFAVYGCTGLKEITVPRESKIIIPWGLYNLQLKALSDIYYLGTQSEWNALQGKESFNTDKEEDLFELGMDALDENREEHYAVVHYAVREYTDWTVTKEPTCTETGIKERRAVNEDGSPRTGDDTVQTGTVPALGHDAAAVEKEGVACFSCTRCGKLLSDPEGLNPITSAEVVTQDIMGSSVSVALDSSHFPDDHFRSCLEAFDTNNNGTLSAEEIRAITWLDCSEKEISSLEGIHHLTSLVSLNVSGNELTALDLSGNHLLQDLDCSRNSLTELILPEDNELLALRCEANELKELDLEAYPSLCVVACAQNPLSSLKVGENSKLISLDCSNGSGTGGLNELNVSGCSALKTLNCSGNRIAALDLSGNPSLEELSCYGNALTNLDISANSSLTTVTADGNHSNILDADQGTFDLSKIEGFDVTKASGWYGGTVKGTILTYDLPTVYYLYDIGNGIQEEFLIGSGKMAENVDSQLSAAASCGSGTIDVNGTAMTLVETQKGQDVVLSVEASHRTGDIICYDWFRDAEETECLASGDDCSIVISGAGYYYVDVYDGHGAGATVWFCVQEEAEEIAVTKVTISKTTAEIATGKTLQLTASVVPSNASDQTIKWSSSNPAVADVDQNGLVKAKKYGKTAITARSANGKKATCEIQTRFSDVNNPGKAYYDAVYWAVEEKITVCTAKFRPDDSVNRGEFTAFLYRLADRPEVSKITTKFKDVNAKTKFAKEISWAVSQGIIKGYSDHTFRPSDTITRAQVAIMLWRYAGSPKVSAKTSPFKDVEPSNTDTYKAIIWGNRNKIIKGSNGSFLPKDNCTRGNVVTFLYRYNNSL